MNTLMLATYVLKSNHQADRAAFAEREAASFAAAGRALAAVAVSLVSFGVVLATLSVA